jgi:hypothetical protein
MMIMIPYFTDPTVSGVSLKLPMALPLSVTIAEIYNTVEVYGERTAGDKRIRRSL